MGSDRGSGAVFEAPALVAGFENVAVMGQAIEQRRRHLGVAEYARPFGEGEICRQDDRGALVKAADQVEQHLPAADREWQVTQLVEDDETDADELIGGAHAGQLELAHQLDDLMPLHSRPPRPTADRAAGRSGHNRLPARSPAPTPWASLPAEADRHRAAAPGC